MTPDVDDFDIVVLLDGDDYGSELQAAAGTALEAFVTRGCDLLMTEWTAYDVEGGATNRIDCRSHASDLSKRQLRRRYHLDGDRHPSPHRWPPCELER